MRTQNSVWHICELLLLCLLLLTLLLLVWLWSCRSEVLPMTPRGKWADLTFGNLSVFILSLSLSSLFFFSQGIPFVVWRSDIGRRNYSSWDVFALIFVWVPSYFPQGFHVQFLCALCMLWCALLPHRWLTLHSLLPGHRCYFACTARELNAQELTSWSSP